MIIGLIVWLWESIVCLSLYWFKGREAAHAYLDKLSEEDRKKREV